MSAPDRNDWYGWGFKRGFWTGLAVGMAFVVVVVEAILLWRAG